LQQPLLLKHPLRRKKPNLLHPQQQHLLQHLHPLKQKPLKVPLPKTKRVQQSLLIKKPRPQPSNIDYNDEYDVVILDLHRSYQRPKIITIDDDKDLSDHIKFRLWLARHIALMKYKEKWA
jgi:hypothetical protein